MQTYPSRFGRSRLRAINPCSASTAASVAYMVFQSFLHIARPCAVALAVAILAARSALAASPYSWNLTTTPNSWSLNTNWTGSPPAGGPSTAGDTDNINTNITANAIINLFNTGDPGTAAKTVGILNIGDTNNTNTFTIAAGSASGSLVLNDNGAGAQINELSTAAGDTISAAIQIADAGGLTIFNGSVNTFTLSGITSSGAANLVLQSNNPTLNATYNDKITISGLVNNSGTITNNGNYGGVTTLSGGIGSNVTAITEYSEYSALTISNTLTVNSGGTTVTNLNAWGGAGSGSQLITISGGVSGTGNLILNNDGFADASTSGPGVIVQGTLAVNNSGSIISNSTARSGNVVVSAPIGSNVTGVIQNSSTTTLTLSNTLAIGNGGTIFASNGALAFNESGAISGTGPLTLDANSSGSITLSNTATGISPTSIANSGASVGTVTISGNILSGLTGAVTQNSARSELILSGTANAYTTGTTINAGLLQFGAAGSVPASGTITINSAGALNVAGAFTTVTGWLGSGKIAAGSAGALALTTATSAETINMAGFSNLMLGASVNSTYSGALTPAATTNFLGGGGATLTLSVANQLNGSNSLVVAAAGSTGTVALTASNNYTGGTTINSGTLQINNDNVLGTAPSPSPATNITFAGSSILQASLFTNVTLNVNRNVSIGAGVNATVDPQTSTTTINGVVSGTTGSLTKISAGTLILNGLNTYGGGTTVQAGVLQFGSGAVPSTGSITINSAGALNVAGAFTTVSGWLGSGKIATGSTGVIALTGGSSETINMAGFSNLMLGASANSTYSGALTPAGGTYRLGGGGATLTLNTVNQLNSGNSLVVGATGATSSTGTVALTASNNFTGGTTINSGTLQINADNVLGAAPSPSPVTNITFAGNSTLQATAPVSLNVNRNIAINSGVIGTLSSTSTAAVLTVNGVISGAAGSLAINGGTVALAGANTFGGGVTLTTGTLDINNGGNSSASSLGTGPFFINGGTIDNTSGSPVTINTNNTEYWTGNFTFTGSSSLNLGTGPVIIPFQNVTTVTALGNPLTIGGVLGSVVSPPGGVGGSEQLIKSGSGTMILAAANTFNGTVQVNAGTLQLNNGLSLQNSTVNPNGGLFVFNSGIGAFTFGGLTGSGNLTLADNASTAITLSIGTNNSAQTYSGALSDLNGTQHGAVNKVGGGTEILTGANTYTGTTTITSGTLQVGATGSLNGTTGTPLTFAGTGTINFDEAASSAPGMGLLTLSAGDGTIQSTFVATSATLTLADMAVRTAGATGNFVTAGTGSTNGSNNKIVLTKFNGSAPATGTLLDPGLFYAGGTTAAAYATYDTGGFVRAYAYASDTAGVSSAAGTTIATAPTFSSAGPASFSSASNVVLAGAISAQTTTAVNALNPATFNLTLGANQILSVNSILTAGGTAGGAITGDTTSGAGGIEPATNGGDLVLRSDMNGDTLTITSNILANGTNALVKSGNGVVTISPAVTNNLTGGLYLNGGLTNNCTHPVGLFIISNANALGSGPITFNGGVLSFKAGGFTIPNNITVNPTGGGIGNFTFNSGNSTQVTAPLAFSGAISGAGTLFVDAQGNVGTANYIFSGNNTNFSGGITSLGNNGRASTVEFRGLNSTGTGPITLGGSAVQVVVMNLRNDGSGAFLTSGLFGTGSSVGAATINVDRLTSTGPTGGVLTLNSLNMADGINSVMYSFTGADGYSLAITNVLVNSRWSRNAAQSNLRQCRDWHGGWPGPRYDA